MAKSFAKTLAFLLSPSNTRLRLTSASSRLYATAKSVPTRPRFAPPSAEDDEVDVIPSEGISRPLSEVLRELNKKVPDSVIKVRTEDNFATKYVPWHIVNRIMNLHAPEWSGEVRNIVYSPDGKSVSVVYRVTIYGTDAEIYRESSGTASVEDAGYGDPVQKAEAMAFRRACARLGLGLHLYHEDML
ncbi:DNA repair RAD52-like protein 1, mitochondrial [Dioscorea cayenensis subsp. rotundata]|uniref:DNA repair RAD52-like protein 1, mitochondrial n=1 Tax=Dioscorea cayennensis subsp. rotundata TaxID=55577 RepID=A0AB40CHQ0_DIOCR|nr:DNA repair RAD52-like protein 1, mitochondrial [Dioscorea cayenensis subsp. rotundata]